MIILVVTFRYGEVSVAQTVTETTKEACYEAQIQLSADISIGGDEHIAVHRKIDCIPIAPK